EQSQGIDQVNTAIAQMDKVTQQNAANAEESASASEELSSQAESMNAIVGELVALVGGASGKKRSARPSRSRSSGLSRRRQSTTVGSRLSAFAAWAINSGSLSRNASSVGSKPGKSQICRTLSPLASFIS
ncbi:MAG: hypothetical protein OQL20_08450, partial [Sedimenticola sp.]|nr:hypothetical protein [Sedimenticola sp.]